MVLQVEDFQQVPGQGFGEDQRALHIQMAVVIVVFPEGESQALNLRVGAVVQVGNLFCLKIGPHFFLVGGIDRRILNFRGCDGHNFNALALAELDDAVVVAYAELGEGIHGFCIVPEVRGDLIRALINGLIEHGTLLVAGVGVIELPVRLEVFCGKLTPHGVVAQQGEFPGKIGLGVVHSADFPDHLLFQGLVRHTLHHFPVDAFLLVGLHVVEQTAEIAEDNIRGLVFQGVEQLIVGRHGAAEGDGKIVAGNACFLVGDDGVIGGIELAGAQA